MRGLAADIGGSFIKFAPVGLDGALGEASRVSTPSTDWDGFCRALHSLCAPFAEDLALSLSIAGIVDAETGVALSANVSCTSGRRLAASLEEALGRRVLVANDADCFALAEARGRGAARGVVFGIILGSGVGGGLVLDGRIVEGAGGIAGEWGHGPILGPIRLGGRDLGPLPCGCGQIGCLDTLGSARGLERIDRHLHGEGRTSPVIVEHWRAGEASAARAVEAWSDIMSGPLAVLVNATGAVLVPVGGGLSNSAPLIAHLDAAVRRRLLRRTAGPLVVPARLGEAAGLLGAAIRLEAFGAGSLPPADREPPP
ncbi:hypothetical protein ASG43_15690 [Aureimonas sp. Leaf454]|nr:hypothetical protein ASG43_15690 [Aureimonas sp. Leaf454]